MAECGALKYTASRVSCNIFLICDAIDLNCFKRLMCSSGSLDLLLPKVHYLDIEREEKGGEGVADDVRAKLPDDLLSSESFSLFFSYVNKNHLCSS